MSAAEIDPVPGTGLKDAVASKVPADTKAIAITYFMVFMFRLFSLFAWVLIAGGILRPPRRNSLWLDPFISLTSFSGNGGVKFSKRVKIFSKPPISAIGTDIDS